MIARLSVTCVLVTLLLTGIAAVVGGGADAATGARVTRWIDGDTVVTT